MTGPGDAVGAHHALAHRAELGHRRLAALVALVDPAVDPSETAVEGAAQHHVLDPPVESGAAEFRAIVGATDLQHAAWSVDAEEARHAGQLVALEQDEGAVAAGAAIE